MALQPMIRLPWRGRDTVAAMPDLLTSAHRIEIALPADVNHALFRILYPDAAESDLEKVNINAGPELLSTLSRIAGLEPLADLAEALRGEDISVAVRSPPTLSITLATDASPADAS